MFLYLVWWDFVQEQYLFKLNIVKIILLENVPKILYLCYSKKGKMVQGN